MKKLLLLLIFIPFISIAQKARLKFADKLYTDLAYYDASKVYEDVLEKGVDSIEIADKIADCYQKIGNTVTAVKWYDYMHEKNKISQTALLQFALMERQLGEYDHSLVLTQQYEQLYGANDITQNMTNELTILKKVEVDRENFKISNEAINTASSEFGTSYFTENKVLITSSKKSNQMVSQVYSWTGDYFYNLYIGDIDSSGKILNMKDINGDINTKFHDGPAVYESTNEFIYFTRDDFLDGKKGVDENRRMRLKIYRAKLANNKLVNIEELPFNNSNYSCAHPTISDDGKQLFFSSDMPGGFGGSDIYSVSINENGTVGVPKNMGSKINTSLNEFFPFYRSNENILFFSSNGLNGYGGLDVFSAKLADDFLVNSVENLGKPINSTADDFSFVNNKNQTKGYFSSNRTDGKGNDDIYSFNQLRPITNSKALKGSVFDLLTSAPIDRSMIYLRKKTGEIIDSTYTNTKGEYILPLKNVNEDVIVTAKSTGYIPNDSILALTQNPDISRVNLNLSQKINYAFTGTVLDKLTNEKLKDVKISIVDAKTNKLISTINTNIIGKFETAVIPELIYNDSINYKFKFEKKGYLTTTETLPLRLAKEEKIDVSELLHPTLVKVINGVTDLADIIKINPIYFDYNQAYIRPDAAIELDKIVQVMLDNPNMVIALYSHTDARGSFKLNQDLSHRRAISSMNYIISKGISAKRITGKGKGESDLKISDEEIKKVHKWDKQEELHQLNRRTEFIIVKLN